MNNDIKRFLLWLLVAVIIIGSFVAIMIFGGGGGGTSGTLTLEVTKDEWMKGNPDAKVTLVEYSDFQCPACRTREPLIKSLLGEFGNHMRFVYRHFPLRANHKNAQITAQASEAAGLQGKFWEMHGMIFENQQIWAEQDTNQTEETLIGYAEKLGLDMEKFKDDLTSGAVKDAINNDYDSGDDAGVNATPTFYLNNKKINPVNNDDFRTLIRQAIESTP